MSRHCTGLDATTEPDLLMPSAYQSTADRPRTLAPVATAPPRARTLEQQFRLALLLTVGIGLVFWLGHYFEREILDRHPGEIRFIRDATEAGMRYITIPHIIIAFLFAVTSLRNRTPVRRLWMVGLLVAGAGFCTVYHLGGAKTNILLTVSVYLFFLVHELRDEAMFYHALGGAAPVPDRATFQKMTRAWIGSLVLIAAAFGWVVVPLGLVQRQTVWGAEALPWVARIALAMGPLIVACAGTHFVLRHYARRLGHADVKALVRTHAPLFRVSLGVLCVLGLSLLITQRAYSLILFHVAGWYVYAAYQLARHPPKAPLQGWWLWMRTTARGFRTLHIGMVLVLMAIGLFWTLGNNEAPYLAWLLAPDSFLYWTIMHITVSFVPR